MSTQMSTKLLIVVENLDSMLESLEEKLAKEKLSNSKNLHCMLETLEERLCKDGVPTSYKGMCAECEEAIHGEVCNALGRSFHPNHFRCIICDDILHDKAYFEREGMAFCEEDYHDQYAPKCLSCQEPVIGSCITLADKTWHPDHFVCEECHQPFTEEGFHEKDGKAYCLDDYTRLFAPTCPGCNDYVIDIVVNTCWHQRCFVCADCKQPLEGRKFFDYEGKPYCESHFRAKRKSICFKCDKLILNQCLRAMGRQYHPEHFTCSYCNEQLNQMMFREKNGKPYCKRCHLKTFGRH